MDIFISILLTISGFILGAIYTSWTDKKHIRRCKTNVINHFIVQATKSEACLKSIEKEFYYWLGIYNDGGIKNKETRESYKDVESISLLHSDFLRSADLFCQSERELIESYIKSNAIIEQHYMTANKHINNSDFLNALYQIQILLLQWIAYVEIRYVLCKILNNKKHDKSYTIASINKGPHYISEMYGVNWTKISEIINEIYNKERRKKFITLTFKYRTIMKTEH